MWNYMVDTKHVPKPTLYKIRIHWVTVISYALVTIGQLSKETAAEARYKHLSTIQTKICSRQFSRESYNNDVFKGILLSSALFLNSIRLDYKKKKKCRPFSSESLQIFFRSR